jgi:hypothetical protein
MLILAAFITVCMLLRREYVVVLGKALTGPTSTSETSLGSDYKDLDDLKRDLESSDPQIVIRCFTQIKNADPIAAKALLPRILEHVSPDVRLYGLKWVQATKDARASVLIKSLIEREESSIVKQEAIETLSILSGN